MSTPAYCDICETAMRFGSAKGLQREGLPGVSFDIDPAIQLWRCDTCDDFVADAETSARINDAIKPHAAEWKRAQCRSLLVRVLAQHPDATQIQIASALGVTATHLSHCVGKTKDPSLTLVRLLQAFVACPSELARHLERRPQLGAAIMHPHIRPRAVAKSPYVSPVASPANDAGLAAS